jgi:hypothetical protein
MWHKYLISLIKVIVSICVGPYVNVVSVLFCGIWGNLQLKDLLFFQNMHWLDRSSLSIAHSGSVCGVGVWQVFIFQKHTVSEIQAIINIYSLSSPVPFVDKIRTDLLSSQSPACRVAEREIRHWKVCMLSVYVCMFCCLYEWEWLVQIIYSVWIIFVIYAYFLLGILTLWIIFLIFSSYYLTYCTFDECWFICRY